MEACLKMKKLIRAEQSLHSSIQLQDSFHLIAQETCKILACDRATVFLLDHKKNELWTKFAIGAKSIRLSATEGIAGYVATTGKYMNVIDAKMDRRFKSEIDQITNYTTKSILCVPIKDPAGSNTLGVI